MNKSKIGIVMSIVGLFIIGLSIGYGLANGETNLGFTFAGVFVVFIGVFVVLFSNKKKLNT